LVKPFSHADSIRRCSCIFSNWAIQVFNDFSYPQTVYSLSVLAAGIALFVISFFVGKKHIEEIEIPA
jgi:hypothetical protein